MSLRRTALALAAALFTAGTQAAVIFNDNFDADPLQLNSTPTGWTVTNGTVDTIGTGYFDLMPGNGRYIDLDGSTGNAGDLSIGLGLTGGLTYTATYALAGSQRGDTNTVAVSFGSANQSHTLASGAGFTPFSLAFTPQASGTYTLMFSHAGGDNIGLLLDNVTVSSAQPNAVPAPPTLVLALAGLMAMGALRRRA